MGQGTRVGEGFSDVVTRKDLIVRMEAPRFFVQTDEVVLSAIVHNYLKRKKRCKWHLEFADASGRRHGGLAGRSHRSDPSARTVDVAPNGEARVDWRVKVLTDGTAVIRMKALTDEESDAMEQRFPCYLHGMLKMESYCGVIRPEGQSGHSLSQCRKSGSPSSRGSTFVFRRRWPGRWSRPCPIWSIIPTAAPSRR